MSNENKYHSIFDKNISEVRFNPNNSHLLDNPIHSTNNTTSKADLLNGILIEKVPTRLFHDFSSPFDGNLESSIALLDAVSGGQWNGYPIHADEGIYVSNGVVLKVNKNGPADLIVKATGGWRHQHLDTLEVQILLAGTKFAVVKTTTDVFDKLVSESS